MIKIRKEQWQEVLDTMLRYNRKSGYVDVIDYKG